MSSLAVVIVSYNTADFLRECLSSVTRIGGCEVVVVDNNSADHSVEMVRASFPDVTLLAESKNLGFGAANNVGVRATAAQYIMLLNSDAVLLEDTGRQLVQYLADHPDVACVAPRIVLPDGSTQPRVFGHQPTLWRVAMQSLGLAALFPRIRALEGVDGVDDGRWERNVGWVSGVCMVMRRADFMAVGGFDPDIFMYCEDVDICARLANSGKRIVRLNSVPVRHYGGASAPSTSGQLRNAVWQQRNLFKIILGRSGPVVTSLARIVVGGGLLIRIAGGIIRIPKAGLQGNILLRSSWLRLRDVLGVGVVSEGR